MWSTAMDPLVMKWVIDSIIKSISMKLAKWQMYQPPTVFEMQLLMKLDYADVIVCIKERGEVGSTNGLGNEHSGIDKKTEN